MSDHKSLMFGEIAVEQGLLTQAQVDECVAIQKQMRERRMSKTLGAICHDKGYLTLVQINKIMEQVEDTRRRHSIEGYEIVSKLGKGGMGAVYLARQLSLGKLVAVKILPPKLASNEDYLKRFRREAVATAKLNHPNIVAAYDVGESNGYNYFVMEYVEGETVKDLLERTGIIEEARALEIVTQIADALSHAWQHEIVHRDIKPANIMINKQGQAKLCDLGLAIDRKEDQSITRSGVIMGTPYYLSPEQARSEELDIRSDIYSLGATLFHMATGAVPYEGDTPAVILTKHLSEPPPDPLARNPLLSKGICYIIAKMMAKDREARYQTPDELLADLRELRERSFLRGKPYAPAARTAHPPETEARTVRVRRVLILGIVLFPLAAAGAAAIVDPALPARVAERARALWRGREALLQSLPRVDDKSETALAAAREAEREAERRFDEAERFAAAHPDEAEEARDRFAKIVEDYGRTGTALKARARIASINNRIDRDAKSLFFGLAVEARELRDRGDYAGALAALARFPARYAQTVWGAQAARERDLVVEAARARWREMAERARGLEAGGDFEGARREIEPALGFGVDEVKALAEAEAARLDARGREAGEAAARAAQAERARLLAKLLAEIGAPMRAGRLEEAAAVAAAAAHAPELARVREAAAAVCGDVELLLAAARRLEERLGAARGTDVRLRIGGVERAGAVDAVRDGRLYLRLGSATVGYSIADVDAAEWLSPATLGSRGAAARLRGVWHLLRGEDREARLAFDEAAREGEDISLYRVAAAKPE
jgi:serine/threonine-protein kinase